MAWESLKAGVAAVVRENNNKEITGTNLNSVLNSIINTVGANATFVGVASPNTSAINPDGPVFYIASQAGTYSSFTVDSQGNPAAVREGYITILKNIGNSLWSKSEVPFSIADSSVTTDKIADRAVTADKVASGAINASKLDNEAVTAEKIAGSAVTSNKIADRAVTTDKIGDQQVTRTKIADESVNAAKISNYAVTTDKLDDEAVTAEKIAEQAVQTEHIADDAIEADKIREYAVTRDKLSEEVTEELDHKANVNGSYERMTVGMSKNIEAPEAVSGIFTLRPTAGGAECASGTAPCGGKPEHQP